MKNKILAGNWKMNKTVAMTEQFFNQLLPCVEGTKNDIILCVPYTDLVVALSLASNSRIYVGAQNCHYKESGAYTGEIAPQMLAELGVQYTIVGHSERRAYYGETDQTVNLKIKALLGYNIKPIVCIGESLQQRENGQTEQHLAEQIKLGFTDISAEQLPNIIVAYEPIWAIGTGVTATVEQAEQTIKYCRDVLTHMYGASVAQQLYILYGGSMNEKNAQSLLSMPNIDGGLIGGASLVADKFVQIINCI
ncbi:MAG: triose-phosphate isomerase [Clostridia bacterium]|nr:triose-phosphate isomerase [Clostridia bacterium]